MSDDDIERLHHELMTTYRRDKHGRVRIVLADRKAIARRAEIREQLAGCWGRLAGLRARRRANG
jgi:hypothetical protein